MKEHLNVTYNTWKQVTQNNSFSIYHIVIGSDVITAWSGNKDFIYKSEIDADDYSDWSGSFIATSTQVSSSNDAVARIIGLSDLKEEPRTYDGKRIQSSWPAEGGKKTFVTHNWCDKTTWYEGSIYVQSGSASNSGDNLEYTLPHTYLIDTFHGNITQEDFLVPSTGSNSYRIKVRVNGVEKTEQDPHYASGSDYTIDYISGTVNFLNALDPVDLVEVDYYYASNSIWTLKPDEGKILKVIRVEVQFSKDVLLKDSIKFQAYGMVNHWAPQYTPTPYPSGTIIPIGDPEVYKTMHDYYNDANGTFPEIGALGSGNWRGCPVSVCSFPWQYQTVTDVCNKKGTEIRIMLDHDEPFEGYSATATFYCLSIDG